MKSSFHSARILVAVIIALVGSVIIWVTVPYNDFWFQNNFISDNFLPVIVVGMLLGLVLVCNPLLRFAGERWMLTRRQLALIVSLLLFASIIPGYGLMHFFPRLVAHTNQEMNASQATAKVAAEANLPRSLFPDPLPTVDTQGQVVTHATPNSDQFLDELYNGQSVPWSAWILPMATWGILILSLWLMMIGMGGVVFPQWRYRERLPFPLLTVYNELIGDTDDPNAHLLPRLFRTRTFWIAAGAVFFIHLLRGVNTFTSAVPSFPLSWDLSPYLKEGILQQSTLALKRQTILFSVLGVAYFIPNRYAFSLWAWVVIQGWYIAFGRLYIPAFNDFQIFNQTTGVLVAIAVWVVWLGRTHWAQVGRAMLGRGKDAPELRRDAVAGWMFAIGCAGIVCWLSWVGCSLWWSILAMLGCAMVALLMARLIAETGLPLFWIPYFTINSITAWFPLSWLSPAILYCSALFEPLLSRTCAMSAAVITTLALGMDRKATPTYRARLLPAALALMVVGFAISGAVHLHMGYHNPILSTQPRMSATVMEKWIGADRSQYTFFSLDHAETFATFLVSTALLWACSRFPTWPLHPIGILFCQFSIGNLIWFSVFLGWLVKNTITGILGGKGYRAARSVFLGLVMGELLAIIIWSLVPVLIVWYSGTDPTMVPRYTIFQYP